MKEATKLAAKTDAASDMRYGHGHEDDHSLSILKHRYDQSRIIKI